MRWAFAMMLVKTRLGMSSIHGIGIFADEAIPRNTIIWRFEPGFDMKFTLKQISKMPDQARTFIETYAYLSKKSGLYILCMDHGKHFNHSDAPNTSNQHHKNEDEVVTRALADLRPGEELTCDYGEFEGPAPSRA